MPGFNTILSRLPRSGRLGFLAAAGAAGLWTAEQLSGWVDLELATIPFKLALLAAPLFFYRELSAFLHGRPRRALALWAALVGVTVLAAIVYLPWREAFARRFNNDVYRWYYDGLKPADPGAYPGLEDWRAGWRRRTPHAIEAGIAMAYHGVIVLACTRWRLGRIRSAALAVAGYAWLLFIPPATRLLVWDCDVFLRGILFDSISMDLHPLAVCFAGDFSIFLYVFLFLFFAVCLGFMGAAMLPPCPVVRRLRPEAHLT